MGDSIMDLMQPEIVCVQDGQAELSFTVRPEFTIPGGVVQGGILGVMLDMAMAFAFAKKGMFSTASLHYDILRPAKGPRLFVTSRIVRSGRRIVFAEAEIKDEAGQVLARGGQTAVPVTMEG